MAYTKQTWSDLAGTGLNKYSIADSDNKKVLTWNPDSITNAGTAVNAERMNHIENGIYTADANASEALEKATDNESDISGLTPRVSALESGKAQIAISEIIHLSSSGWEASGSLYKQSLSLSGLLATDVPLCQAICTSEDESDWWNNIIRVEARANWIDFYSLTGVSGQLRVQVVVIR